MARINIENCWWTDPRRERLGSLLGSILLADAVVIRAWRLAQEFWGNQRGLVPAHVFDTLESGEKLIQSNLAEVRQDGVYIRGSSQYLDWIYEQRETAKENGSKGGKKSAQRPRNEKGHFYPAENPSETQATSKPPPSDVQANPSKSKLSDSGSGSYSGSNTKHTPQKVFEHPTSATDRRFNVCGEVVDAVREMVDQVFEKKVPPRIRNRIQDLASKFETADNFQTHLNEILHDDRALPDAPKRFGFIEGWMLRQLEVIQ